MNTNRGFAVIKDLRVGNDASPERTINRLGELLAPSKIRGALQLRLLDVHTGAERSGADRARFLNVVLDGTGFKCGTEAIDKPDLELLTTSEVWAEIARGELAPIAAFLAGRMRVRGAVRFAQRVHKHVAAGEGRTQLCGEH
jgi:hypothetical protein